jgi:Cu(I)/Ag(I) efflux system protein CusF
MSEMKRIRYSRLAAAVFASGAIAMTPAFAQDKMKMDHGSHDSHGSMKMEAPADVTEAEAKGKVNSIDADGGTVNVTHDPVPALGWPAMTMDLPVTRRVDLSAVKPGTPVTFKLKKGRDNQFRIIDIAPSQ